MLDVFRRFRPGQAPAGKALGSLIAILLAVSLLVPAGWGQSQTGSGSAGQQGGNQQQQQAPSGEAGGPQGDIGPIAVPKKKEEAPPPPPPTAPKKIPGMPNYSIQVNVPLVTEDIIVTTKDGQFVPGLHKDNFRLYENGTPQNITSFSQSQAPITAVLLVEFAATNYSFMYDALNTSYYFANSLKPNDWVAVVSYDMKPYILVDFTQDKRSVFGALDRLRIPGFSETNLFDALYDVLDRLDRIEGRKDIILVSTGRDTFSRLTLDQILQKVKATPNVTIFPISIGFLWREYVDSHYGTNPDVSMAMMDYLQADNQMRTFAKLTGGKAYFPRFDGELPDIYRDIGNSIRNQYTLAYHPTDPKLDGTYRKIKVELVAADGKPLQIRDQKNKPLKVTLSYREGYTAKREVE